MSKINNINLTELSGKQAQNKRKGTLKSIVTDEYDISTGRPTVDGKRKPGFKGIGLSDAGEELLDIDVDKI